MVKTLPPSIVRLKELVDADPRTQTAIAKEAGIDFRFLSAILRGRRPNPTLAITDKILRALGKDWGDLNPSKVPEQVA